MIRASKIYSSRDDFLNNRGGYFTKNGVTKELAELIWDDTAYGFIEPKNLRVWGDICVQAQGGFSKKIIIDYFDLNTTALTEFLNVFCADWKTQENKVRAEACISTTCELQEIFYSQWTEGKLSNTSFGSMSMNHFQYIEGEPEVTIFLQNSFIANKSDEFKNQFKTVTFLNNQSRLIYSKLFSQTDLKNSLFNFDTIKALFDIGMTVDNQTSSGEIDVSPFTKLTSTLDYMTEKEAYVLYKYLHKLSNTTYLQGELHDTASFAYITAGLFKSEIEGFIVDFGSEYLGMAINRYFKYETCQGAVVRLFPGKASQYTRFCGDETAPQTLDGIKFWIRLYIGRRQSDITILEKVTSYKLSEFIDDFDNESSNFHKIIRSILDSIGMGKIRENICNQDYNQL